eukprot:1705477-Prymnesium_polylepis.1
MCAAHACPCATVFCVPTYSTPALHCCTDTAPLIGYAFDTAGGKARAQAPRVGRAGISASTRVRCAAA